VKSNEPSTDPPTAVELPLPLLQQRGHAFLSCR